MKVQLEGEPSEIAAFLQQFQARQTETAIIPPPAQAPVAEAVAEPEPEIEQTAEVEEPQREERPPVHVFQAPIKDQITMFLEGRKKAKIKDIAKAIKKSPKQVTPRIAELVESGVVRKLTNKRFHNDFALHRDEDVTKTETKAAKPSKPQPAPVGGKAVKDAILAYLETRDKAPALEIRTALNIAKSNPVSSALVHLRNEGKIIKLDNENAPADYALASKQQQPEPEPEAVVVEEQQPVEEQKTDATPTSDATAIKELIIEFLRENPDSTVRQIRTALGEKRGNTVTARLVELRQAGRVNKIDRNGKHAVYALVTSQAPAAPAPAKIQRSKVQEKPVFTIDETPIKPEQVEYLRIMDALVSRPGASYYDLERITNMSRGTLSSRLIDLEQMRLVERAGGRRSGPVEWTPIPPTDGNEMPLFQGTLDDAISEALKKHPGASSEQVSILLMKSHKDVEKRLHAMTNVIKRGTKFFLRGLVRA